MDDLNRIGQPVSGFQHHAVKQQQKKAVLICKTLYFPQTI